MGLTMQPRKTHALGYVTRPMAADLLLKSAWGVVNAPDLHLNCLPGTLHRGFAAMTEGALFGTHRRGSAYS